MDRELFNPQSSFVSSSRIIYTPSAFARTSLLHLQEVGSLQAVHPHVSQRSDLVSFLCFIVLSGEGELSYEEQTYQLGQGDCVFIDCRKAYSHSTSDNLWSLQWCHFYAPSLPAVYEKYKERGGRPVFHPADIKPFTTLLTDIYDLASSSDYIRDMRINEKLGTLLTLLMEQSWHPESITISRKRLELATVKEYLDEHEDLFNKYDTLNKISFDYAVVEHEPEIEVMRFAGTWKDLGTWNTLTEAMDSHAVGEALFNEKCENVHVVNELDVPILCMGLKDVVVSASPEGILVSDKEQSSYIKPFVNTLDHRVMFAEKSWGSFKVIDIDKASMTIKVTLNAGHQMNYHSHQHRDEVWTVIAGEGKTIVDGMEQNVKAGDVITMSAGCRHTVIAETELKLIEVQLGEAIDVHDKQKFELEY